MHARQNVLEKACFWCFPSPLSKETRRRKRNGEEKAPLLDPEERRRCGTPKNGAGKGKEERKKEGRGIFRGYSQGKLRFDPEGARRVERIRTVRDANSVKRGRRQASWIGTRRIEIARRIADKKKLSIEILKNSSSSWGVELRFFPTCCPISADKN